jgi:hypothetical protein
MSVGRLRFRPPGVKTGSRIGPLGPFRGTLGIQWVIASIAVALVILLVVSYLLFKTPGPPFQLVAEIDTVKPGSAREVLAGVFLGRTVDGQPYAVAEPDNCPLEVLDGYYVDCSDRKYGLDGKPATGKRSPLHVLPIEVHRGDVYVDPTPAD